MDRNKNMGKKKKHLILMVKKFWKMKKRIMWKVGKKRQQTIKLKSIQMNKPINQVTNSASLSLIQKNFSPLNSIPNQNNIINSIVSTPLSPVSTRNQTRNPKKGPKFKRNQKKVIIWNRIVKSNKSKWIIITTIFNRL